MLRNFDAIAPFDRGVEIGIVEHDEGRVAAQFQRDLLHRATRIGASECLPTSVEPVKENLRTSGFSVSSLPTARGFASR